jgi:formamidopyrimidine-DNA glycosylase
MPELPEVETVARVLRRSVVGERITGVEVGWPRIVATPSAELFARELPGHTIRDVTRRAKFLVLRLEPSAWLLVHLRMTGRLLVDDSPRPPDAHTHARLRLSSERELVFHDQRKFGRLWLVAQAEEVIGGLGPEPLGDDLTPAVWQALLLAHRGRIKGVLTNQRVLAGVGNIYVDESLWAAGIHPQRPAHTLDAVEAARLYTALREILACAIAKRGTTLRDFRDPHGDAGSNQELLQVYGRRGEACPRCGATITRIVVGGRGTYLCPQCQPQA